MSHAPAQNSTDSPADVQEAHEDVPDRERRVEAYAEALLAVTWPNGDRIDGVTKRTAALLSPAVVTLADSEQAALVAKVAELEAHKAEWRETAHTNKRQWMEAIDRAIAAEATLAKVAALLPAECWVSRSETVRCTDIIGGHLNGNPEAVFTEEACCLPCRVRESLASAGRPATSDGEDANGGALVAVKALRETIAASRERGAAFDAWRMTALLDEALSGHLCHNPNPDCPVCERESASPVVAPSATDEDGGDRG